MGGVRKDQFIKLLLQTVDFRDGRFIEKLGSTLLPKEKRKS